MAALAFFPVWDFVLNKCCLVENCNLRLIFKHKFIIFAKINKGLLDTICLRLSVNLTV